MSGAASFPSATISTSTNLVTSLERAAGFPDTGLRFLDRCERERWMSWPEIHERAVEVAGGLRSLGVEPGNRVAMIFPTGPDFFAAFFGALCAGAVPAPLYPPVRLGRLAEYHRRTAGMLEAAGAVAVLAEGRVRRLLGETVALARPRLGCLRLDDLPAGSHQPVACAPDDLALVQFSSGTTVDPKPVALSHRAVIAQVAALNSFWPDDAEVRHSGVSWLPLYHDMGLIGCVFPALERPAVLTLLGPEVFVVRPATWLRAISRYRATVSPAPNFAYGLCVTKIADRELDGVDLSCWRAALNGAESVAPAVLRAFTERFARWGFRPEALTPVYGLSEAALAVTFSDLASPPSFKRVDREALAAHGEAREEPAGAEMVSVGRPLPGFDVKIAGDGSETLAERRVGRVLVRGPSLMAGYLDRPDATARAFRDGWLDTGDLGFLLDGELFLTGRAKDLVILCGRNYAPEDIEHAVQDLPAFRRGCAVAVSHMSEGGDREELILFVEHRADAGEEGLSALSTACERAVLAGTGLSPDRVVVLCPGTIPRTSSGKLRRAETLRLHVAGELNAPLDVTPLRLAGAFARSSLAYARMRLGGSSPLPESDG